MTEDPDEMPHNAAFHQGLHCLLRLNNLQGQKYIINLVRFLGSTPIVCNGQTYSKIIKRLFSNGTTQVIVLTQKMTYSLAQLWG